MLTKEQRDKLKAMDKPRRVREKQLMKALNKVGDVLSKYDNDLYLVSSSEVNEEHIKFPISNANLEIKYFAEYNGRVFYLEEKAELIKWILESNNENIENMSLLTLNVKKKEAEKLIIWQRKIILELD